MYYSADMKNEDYPSNLLFFCIIYSEFRKSSDPLTFFTLRYAAVMLRFRKNPSTIGTVCLISLPSLSLYPILLPLFSLSVKLPTLFFVNVIPAAKNNETFITGQLGTIFLV